MGGNLRRRKWLPGWCLWFLDAIGIYRVRGGDQESQLARFRLYHTEFRRLLSANSDFLSIIGEFENLRQGERAFDHAWVKAQALRASVDVADMVSSLNAISEGDYAALEARREAITADLNKRLTLTLEGIEIPLVMEMSEVRARDAWLVGGKMANLGEIRNGAGLPTPDGFVVTVEGYHRVLSSAGIDVGAPSQEGTPLEPEAPESMFQDLPAEIKQALDGAHRRLSDRLGRAPLLAVRSSALGEDSQLSFAGQFHTVLQVPGDGLIEAYRTVLRSLYSPQAVTYRRLHGVPDSSLAMAVGCIEMIDPIAAGVAYSVDPRGGNSGHILIQTVRGLASSLVDGQASPEIIELERGQPPRVMAFSPSNQEVAVRGQSGGGVQTEPVSAEARMSRCINDEEAIRLAELVLRLETHFGAPQDIEWALDRERRFWFLQSRPLRVFTQAQVEQPAVSGRTVLISGGEIACPGVATGTVFPATENDDLSAFPGGAILVAPRSSPVFVQVMAKARAIVTDLGSATGHMATIAREFKVPALVDTRNATSTLRPGQLVTVDARGRRVYEGAVPELHNQEEQLSATVEGGRAGMRGTPAFQLLESAAKLLMPLRLFHPSLPTFSPDNCVTLHDIARFVHEKSYTEMFHIGGRLGDMRQAGLRLDVFLPIDLFVFDLGGGVQVPAGARKVKPAQVTSVPLAALLEGMLDPRIPRFGARPMDVQGLLGIMMRHAMESPEEGHMFRDPCYALASDRYLNYTARVGYHFGVVDAYCGLTATKNYISVLFRGGAADLARRERRVRAIGRVLEHDGFAVVVDGDAVHARLSKRKREEIAGHLTMIGRLFQFFRQMDAAMNSEESMRVILQAFLEEDYGLTRLEGGASGIGG